MPTLRKRWRSAATLSLLACLSLPATGSAVVRLNEPVPVVSATTLSGQKLSLASFRGSVVILDFFASWCAPCRESVPELLQLQRKYGKQGLQVVGLAVEDEEKAIRQFVAEQKIPYPVALVGGDVGDRFGLRGIPAIFVISKKGIVIERFSGLSIENERRLEQLVRKLLAQ